MIYLSIRMQIRAPASKYRERESLIEGKHLASFELRNGGGGGGRVDLIEGSAVSIPHLLKASASIDKHDFLSAGIFLVFCGKIAFSDDRSQVKTISKL